MDNPAIARRRIPVHDFLVVKNSTPIALVLLNKLRTEYEVNVELKSINYYFLRPQSIAFCGPVR